MSDRHALPELLDELRAQLVDAARREQEAERSRGRRAGKPRWPFGRRGGRPLLLVTIGLVTAGTATAAIVAVTSTSDLDRHATSTAPAVAAIDRVLDGLRSTAAAVGRSPLTGRHGTVRGLTVSRDGIHVDVSLDDRDLCLAYRTTDQPTGESACAPRPVPADRPPFLVGQDRERTWVTAIVPDGTTDIIATGTDGTRDTATVQRNVAIAVLPSPTDVRDLTWTTADGSTVVQRPGHDPQRTPSSPAMVRRSPVASGKRSPPLAKTSVDR
ncbi:MAG: hypothetical protein AB7G37_14625 [Solirubrobacteraceae bacterium]